jgi:hypothetical protein
MTILQSGLILNIGGTFLIFFCGFPSKIQQDKSAGSLSWGNLSEEENKKRILRNKWITFGAYLGLSLISLGFILQLIDSLKHS